ncbi:MAG: cytochrome c oxidase assembly protein [Betaproteobacteria bacterium]|nr:MAG: cytochrome c oxidase assembly protein [Betaproteobacteria bacterium]
MDGRPAGLALIDGRAHELRVLVALASGVPAVALAHVDVSPAADAWTAWDFKADIAGGIVLVALLYAAGMWRLRAKERFSLPWRQAAFFGGLAALFLALQSPLDALAGHSFFMHQLQHLLLQTVAPVLLMLAAPQAALVAGFPAPLRRAIVAPILASRPVREVFGFLVRPWSAALLLVASLYAWHWPAYHDLALRDEPVHYLMHITMLAAGLLFFSCIFDSRPAPLGARYGARINALWAAMTACMLLGAGLALKSTALYPAYDELGRLWHMGALEDERLGGLIMWIPGSAAWVPAFLVLLRRWDTQEARLHDRRRRGIAPAVAATATANCRLGLLIGLLALGGFVTTLAIGWIATAAHR